MEVLVLACVLWRTASFSVLLNNRGWTSLVSREEGWEDEKKRVWWQGKRKKNYLLTTRDCFCYSTKNWNHEL